MSGREGRLAGERWNRLVKGIIDRYQDRVEMVKEEMLRSGYPPFHVPLSPREQYDKLSALRMAGDPAFFSDPEAQALLAELSQRFGPPPAPVIGPYGSSF